MAKCVNHINLAVPNVQETQAFLEKYFGLRFFQSPVTDKIVVALDDNDSLIALSNFSGTEDIRYPGTFHIGFNLSSREEVDALHNRLTADGYKVGKRTEFHMAWTFYIHAPGGFVVEVFHQSGMDMIRKIKPSTESHP